MDRPRIAITGLGCVSPLGVTAEATWQAMKTGTCAIGPITTAPLHDLKIDIAGEITADVAAQIDERRRTMLDRFAMLAIVAAREALSQSGLVLDETTAPRVATIVGVGVCGWEAIEDSYRRVFLEGAKRTNIFTVPRVMPSAAASQVSMDLGTRGPVFGVTSACSSSNHALFTAAQMIRSGMVDAAIVGGAEAPLVYGVLKAWEALRILAPDGCRPFTLGRRGLVLAEGAGIAVLENADHARARGAPILAELAGVGATADAGDLVNPSEEGAAAAIRLCLDDAMMEPAEIDYVNAHGTGTRANDITETRAIRAVFGPHADALSVSATKSLHGHALGASGAIELVACVNAIRDGVVPPTANYGEPDPECDLDVTPNVARERTVDAALSNAFAFGGLNAVIAVQRWRDRAA